MSLKRMFTCGVNMKGIRMGGSVFVAMCCTSSVTSPLYVSKVTFARNKVFIYVAMVDDGNGFVDKDDVDETNSHDKKICISFSFKNCKGTT